MFFKRKQGTFYNLIDKLIEQTKKTKDIQLKWKILISLLEIRWTKNYIQEAERINKALDSKGEQIRQARERYKDDKLALEREKKDTSLINAKLEILNILMEGIE